MNLIGPSCFQCTWLAAYLRHPLQATVRQLADLTQQSVQARLTSHIQAMVSQARHDLAKRQILELIAMD